MIGKIIAWNPDRGFGLLQGKNGREIFAHVSQFGTDRKPIGWQPPIGAKVSFELTTDPRSGKERAAAIEFA